MAYTTIDKPTDYFNTVLFTGNGSTQSITGVGFQPDWVWIKNRGATTNHEMADVVRGVNKLLKPNDTDAEQSNSNKITSFDSDGFGVGNDANVNQSSTNIVSWNWKAGGSASSNTDGSITSNVSASTDAGFSIVSYTGTGSNATVGHGLGAEAKWIIFKDRDTTAEWRSYHVGSGNTGALDFNTSDAIQTTSVFFQNTTPTSSVFSLGTGTDVNNTNAFIAYCFAEKKGYSKFGSYTGNGNADGTFVYTGFRPAWLLTKKSSGAGDSWNLLDSKRNTFNPADKRITVDTANPEATTTQYDFLSNGFKVRNTTGAVNTSGANYIYSAFAESPFVTSGGIPTTAR
jgi:hypothetical protein